MTHLKKIALGMLTVATLVSIGLVQRDANSTPTPSQQADTSTPAEKLKTRIDDTNSKAFQDWSQTVKAANLSKQDILDFLDSDLSDAQKNLMLTEALKKMGGTGSFAELKQWQKRLANTLFEKDVDDRLGDKIGRILSRASTPEELKALEDRYLQTSSTMARGNKIAIIMASQNTQFIGQVLDNNEEHLGVRESAIERLADLGDKLKLTDVAAENSGADPVLKITSLHNLGMKAENTNELSDIITLSKTQTEKDSLGRTAQSVAQTGISESQVDGKSRVLFSEWENAVNNMQNNPPNQDELVQTLVTGKALARAIWTENDPATAKRLIETQLTPLIQNQMQRSQNNSGNLETLQALAEFNKDFYSECANRFAGICNDTNDSRMAFREELSTRIKPLLANTELAFYNQTLNDN